MPDENSRDWFSIPSTDPLTEHIAAILWDQKITPKNWQAARLSRAGYIYREKETDWKIITKFYAPKTGKDALRSYIFVYTKGRGRIGRAQKCLNTIA